MHATADVAMTHATAHDMTHFFLHRKNVSMTTRMMMSSTPATAMRAKRIVSSTERPSSSSTAGCEHTTVLASQLYIM